MQEPKLMPFQDQPFNGDTEIEAEFLKLKEKYGLINAVETGSAVGGTTKWLSENFHRVFSVEVNGQYLEFAKARCAAKKNIKFFHGDSPKVLSTMLNKLSNRTIYFLDAHWGDVCPLKNELQSIAHAGLRPVIVIHDFYVPGSAYSTQDRAAGLGFDSYNGQPFTIEWIKPELEKIYNDQTVEGKKPQDEYEFYYNSPDTAKGARRGIVYIVPL